MNRRVITSSVRVFGLLIAFIAVALQPLAQNEPIPLPVPEENAVLADMWAVTLTPGADANAIAAELGVVNAGPINGTPNTYIFRGTGQVRRANAESTQRVTSGLSDTPEIVNIVQQVLLDRPTRGVEDGITDTLFGNQWHLNNSGQFGGTPGNDANVFPAWNAGFTGAGIVVASVDDGLRHANPDLTNNYTAAHSWNFVGNNGDPSGGGHGTAVGGVMAADNDGTCGVGAAFNAQVAGLRLLNANTDANEAAALTYHYNDIDIYNSSWGPSDTGGVLSGPGPLTQAALMSGIANGRGGLGSIYVWASGNGSNADNVNADGYANSRYTIAVAATDRQGKRSTYSEQGSPILINAPSSETLGSPLGITTTSYSDSGCINSFGGTSSASPLAAGIVALMLQANPNLTWRDVQHILVQTAVKNDPGNTSWADNGAGHHFSHYYGFGRIDAGAAVTAAQSWTNVTPETTFDSGTIAVNKKVLNSGAFAVSRFTVSSTLRVESVDVILNATHAKRGQLYIELISPSGTKSVLMHGRPNDSGANYNNWRFNTVANWGELSPGVWTLRVKDLTPGITGTLNSWRLQIHGTDIPSTAISQEPASRSVLLDESVTLSVATYGGSPVHYQWYEGTSGDTSTPVGTDSPTFTTPPLLTDTAYWVSVSGTSPSTDSQTSSLTILNDADMLANPSFASATPGRWKFSNSEGSVVCNRKYVSASCAARLRNFNAETAKMEQRVLLRSYPWSFRLGDTYTLTGQALLSPTAKGVIRIVIQYKNGTVDRTTAALPTGDNTWHPFSISVTQTRAKPIKAILMRVTNPSKVTGSSVWLDDVQVTQTRTAPAPRGADSVLPPPTMPDGLRGAN